MATTKAQRYGIMTILIATVLGTVGSFAVMIISTKTDAADQAKYQAAVDKYTAIQKDYQAKVQAQANQLSAQYYPTFSQYFDLVGKFNIGDVKTLSTEDLLVGNGDEVTGTTSFSVYYLGWDAYGNEFTGGNTVDFSSKKLTAPMPIDGGLDKASLIQGWKAGIKGMHIGGIRLITIPSDQAYGEQGSTDQSGQQTIAPNMPLKFIVMAIPSPTPVPQPDVSSLIQTIQSTQPQ